jgi:hypothetical protein
MPFKMMLVFLLLFLLAACGAPAAELPAPVTATNLPPATQVQAEAPPQPEAATPTPEPVAQIIEPSPTSRGDALVATDPALLNFQTGRPQLVEFFRFT